MKIKIFLCLTYVFRIRKMRDIKNFYYTFIFSITMIKKIHYCWFGSEKPDIVKRNVEQWAQLNPDFEICEWNEYNINISKYEFGRRALEQRKWGFLVDTIRPQKLVEQGGFYIDADVELISPLSTLSDTPNLLQMGYMYNCALGTSILYAPPAHPYLQDILHSYNYIKPDLWPVSNTIFTAYFINRVKDFILNGKEWQNDYCRIFSKETFEQPSFIRSHGISIHHCCGSWKKEFNNQFGFSGSTSFISHLLKWASRKRRTYLATRVNEFSPCYKAALKGKHINFDISGIYTTSTPYTT